MHCLLVPNRPFFVLLWDIETIPCRHFSLIAVSLLGFVTRRSWRDIVRVRGFLLLCTISKSMAGNESASKRSNSTLFRKLHRLAMAFTIQWDFSHLSATFAYEFWPAHSGKFLHLWKAGVLVVATYSPKGYELNMGMGSYFKSVLLCILPQLFRILVVDLSLFHFCKAYSF